jgi:ABC-type amino acid transport substrate-binding protein
VTGHGAVRRWPALVALALTMALSAAGASAFDLPEIKKRGTLRVLAVVSGEETYFVSGRADLPPGFDVEILEGFAKLHSLKLELVAVSRWDGLIPALRQTKGDLIAGGFTDTESRREQIDFTAEVFPTRSVVMTRRPNAVVQSIEQLKARKVGTIRGTFMEEELAAAGIANVDTSIGTGELPLALKAARIEAAVDGLEAALTAKAKDPDLQCGIFLGRPSSLAYGVRKDDRALRAALNAYISNVRRTSTWSRLVVKYFGPASLEILNKARGR